MLTREFFVDFRAEFDGFFMRRTQVGIVLQGRYAHQGQQVKKTQILPKRCADNLVSTLPNTISILGRVPTTAQRQPFGEYIAMLR